MSESELDDPVVREVDVFLNKPSSSSAAAAGQIYVLQFPIRPTARTNDPKRYLSAKIKPQQSKLELEIDLDTQAKHYSKTKGEQFALNVDGKQGPGAAASFGGLGGGAGSQQQRYYRSSLMDKLVFGSTNATPGQMNKLYQLGYYKAGAIYLTPVQSVLQMRPNFEYFDIYEQKVKDIKGPQAGMDTDYSTEEEADAEHEKAELVTLKYSTHHVQEAEPGWLKVNIEQTVAEPLRQANLMYDTAVHQDRIHLNYNNEELLQRIITPDVAASNSTAAATAAAAAAIEVKPEQTEPAAATAATATVIPKLEPGV